jgi:hypothetical protein
MTLARAAKSATRDLAPRTEDETALTVLKDPKWKARGVLSQSLAKIVSNPERVDPIELHGGRTLRAIGTKQGVDVVACLSDLTPLAYEAALEGPKIDRNAFAAALQKAMDTEIATDQRVLTARPKKPVETEENRVSRPGSRDVPSQGAQGQEGGYPRPRPTAF